MAMDLMVGLASTEEIKVIGKNGQCVATIDKINSKKNFVFDWQIVVLKEYRGEGKVNWFDLSSGRVKGYSLDRHFKADLNTFCVGEPL